jgi:hypothetical protein
VDVEVFREIPQYLATGAFVIFAVVALLRTIAVVVPKLRGAERTAIAPSGATASVANPPAPELAHSSQPDRQGFAILAVRIDSLKSHIDTRFDDLCARVADVEVETRQNTTAIARQQGRDEGRHDAALPQRKS